MRFCVVRRIVTLQESIKPEIMYAIFKYSITDNKHGKWCNGSCKKLTQI